MAALPPKAEIGSACRDVRFVPTADILTVENDELALLMDG
jgi:hypothetical protein